MYINVPEVALDYAIALSTQGVKATQLPGTEIPFLVLIITMVTHCSHGVAI